MRIMHLSDLHFGKLVLEQSMIEDQKYIVDEILKIVKSKEIDMVLIAGDVYDKGIPSIEAVNLFSYFLTSLYQLSVKVLVISGNHDSKDRLSFGNELFSLNGVYIEGTFKGSLRKEVFYDDYGKLNIYMLPFVKPIDVRGYYPNCEINSYQEAIKCILDNTDINKSERNIIMIHQFVTASGVDVLRSDSESISLGGLDNVDFSLFDDFDYVAMGHIHGGQKLIRNTVRYAGSPLKYSFSEVNQNKSVCIIDFKCRDDIDIELVPLIGIRDMRIIKGPMDKLLDRDVYSLGNVDDYIEAVITDDEYIVDAVFEDFYFKQNNISLDDKGKRIVMKVIKEVSDEAN
jgi:exonuclease SbcD